MVRGSITINDNVKVGVDYDAFAEVDLSAYIRKNVSDYTRVSEIPKENMDYLTKVKYAVNCYQMFFGCTKLISLDLSKFNTSKLTNIVKMFDSCNSLTNINLSNWDTDKLINMSGLFNSCNSLTAIDISHFNTSNVNSMKSVFLVVVH